MQNLKKAQELSNRADVYKSEGNFEYAQRCYKKIIGFLKESLSIASTQESINQLKNKIIKYQQLAEEMKLKENKKNELPVKATKFGFPEVKAQQIYMNQTQNVRNKYNEPAGNQNRKQIFRKSEEKYKDIDGDVEKLIVRNITITFKDVAGMADVKSMLQEAVIRPRQRPDLFKGIRAPPRGILLYGPPGNGKTFICKALANECGCTFIALSASSVMNKLVGESEKTLKKIFATAEKLSPSIIFIDEIDSILTSRSQNENEASRRLKTEFLVLLDGITSPKSGEILVIGATNLPKELDAAAKRRFNKFILVGQPDLTAREEILLTSLKEVKYDLTKSDIAKIVSKFENYSASQIKDIVKQACMIPLREIKKSQFESINEKDLREIKLKDFLVAIDDKKPLLSKEELAKYKEKM